MAKKKPLPTKRIKKILLLGEPRFVAEIAQLLTVQSRPFYILNRDIADYEMEQMEEDMTAMMKEMMGINDSSSDDRPIHPYFEPYEEHIINSVFDLPENEEIEVVIESSNETTSVKLQPLQDIAEEFPGALILVSTLTCSATEINALLPLASQVIGFNGLPGWSGRQVVELAPSLRTRDISKTRAKDFFESLGYITEFVEDRVGLVQPRILAMLINEAAFAVMENVATPADIDTAMKLGVNYPKGLLEWADEIGIDTIVLILEALYSEYKQERYRPCVLLKQYMRAGWIGRETGKGFYSYLAQN
jgi:3-hydroxybutyryl-CoA dehydrogenase